jgi:integrase
MERYTEAKKWAQMTESAVLEGRHFTATEAKRHTLADLIDRYICEVLPHKRASTVPDQARQLNWWKTQLGHSLLAEVTPTIIVRYRNTLTHGRANGTVNRYLAVLSHAFTVVVKEWQWCADNPVRKVSKPKEPRGRVRFLADDERERLLAACQTSRNKQLYAITVLALATGARRGELLNLRWADVDVKRGMLTFHQTKNGERRAVPLTGYALDVLTQHAKVRRLDTPLVFPDSTGTRPVGIREAFEWAVKRADIANFKFHDLAKHSSQNSYRENFPMYNRNPRDDFPDVRDGLTHQERIVLQCLYDLQHERGGRNTVSAPGQGNDSGTE